MNNKAIKLGLLLSLSCLILLSLVACRSAVTDNQTGKPNVKPPETASVKPAPPASVKPTETATAKPGEIVPHVTADGRLSYVDQRSLTFGTSGTVDQIKVSELDKVTKGQVLAKLDTTSLERAVKTAEVTLNSAEVDQKHAELDVRDAELDLEQASDNFRKISYPYTYSTFFFDVPTALDYISSVSRQLNDINKILDAGNSASRHAEIAAQLQAAQEDLTSARESLARGAGPDIFEQRLLAVKDFWTLRTAQLDMEKAKVALEDANNAAVKAKLAVDKAKYDLDTANETLDKATIVAPFDGVIAKVNIEEGDRLSSTSYATTIAIEIIDPSRMELDVKVNELDIPKVKLGQKVTISVDALPDERLESVVTSISSLPEVVAGMASYEVKIVFNVPENSALKAGMAATADIIAAKPS